MEKTKTLFILGAGPGLSTALARTYGAEGWRVVLFSRNADHLQTLCNDLRRRDIDAHFRQLDCSRLETIAPVLTQSQEAFGVPSCIIYNTCTITPDTLETADALHWPSRFSGDVAGALVTAQTLCTEQFARRNGALLLTGGIAGIHALRGYLSLCVDKAALRMLAFCLHDDLKAKGIFAGIVQIATVIDWNSRQGDPMRIAAFFRRFHEQRNSWEVIYTGEEQC